MLLCTIHNVHATRKKDLKRPADFNPFKIIEKKRAAEAFLRENKKPETLVEFIGRNQRR